MEKEIDIQGLYRQITYIKLQFDKICLVILNGIEEDKAVRLGHNLSKLEDAITVLYDQVDKQVRPF